MNETPKRGWLTFSIRDLMWLTVVVALAVGWGVNYRQLQTMLKSPLD